MKSNLIMILLILGLIATPWFFRKTEIRNERFNVVAVWKHEVNRYSVTIKEGNILVDRGFAIDSVLITDVPEGSNMWYEAYYNYNSFSGGGYKWVNIHIHSVDDIGNAGWNHGKFGSGSTERVQ